MLELPTCQELSLELYQLLELVKKKIVGSEKFQKFVISKDRLQLFATSKQPC